MKVNFDILKNPEKAFLKIQKQSLDDVIYNYLQSLQFFAIFYAVLGAIYDVGRAVYFDFIAGLVVNYSRVFNLALTTLFATVFVYFLAGTFLVLIATLLFHSTFLRHLKYVDSVKVILPAMTPILIFGGISRYHPLVFIWAAFLMIPGSEVLSKTKKRLSVNDRRE